MQTSCEPFGNHIGTDGNSRASQVATGYLSLDWDSLESASGPELTPIDGRQTDDMLPKIISLDSSGSEEGISQLT